MRDRFISIILLIPLAILTFSCSQNGPEWKGTIEEIDGVTYIKNPKRPIVQGDILSIEEDLSIGKAEGEENYMFNSVHSIDVDEDENIYALDTQSAHVRVFNKKGEFVRLIGQMGQGPGEMQRPYFVQVTSQGELFAHDPFTRRFVVFSLDGKYLKQISLSRIMYPKHPVKIDTSGELITRIVPPPPEGGTEVKKFDANLELLFMISKEKMDDSYLRDEIRLLKPSLFCAVSQNDYIIWGNSEKYELRVLDPEGKLFKIISRDQRALKLTDREKELLKNSTSGLYAVKGGFKAIVPDLYPAFQHISVDEDGRIFVKTYERVDDKKSDFYFDVFDSEGKYIAKFKSWIRPHVWKKGKVYTIESNPDGFPVVKRYKVTWDY